MAIFFKPRRGTYNKATSSLSGSNRLQSGEIFFETPSTGEGKGVGKIKMGDGTTDYASLPYFLDPSQFAAASHTHTVSEITDFSASVQSIKVTNCTSADSAATAYNIPVNPTSTSNMNIWIES